MLNSTNTASKAELLFASKTTVSSFCNIIIVSEILIYFFINETVDLNRNSLFIAKTLPYSENEIWVAYKTFKGLCNLAILELVLIILAPAVKLLSVTMSSSFLFLISLHLIFLTVFCILDFLYDSEHKIFTSSKRTVWSITELLIILLSGFYFMTVRFKVDSYIGYSDISIRNLIRCIFFSSMLLFIIFMALTIICKPSTPIFEKAHFFNIRLFYCFKLNLSPTMSAIVRTKNFLYILTFSTIVIVISLFQDTLNNALQSMMIVLPMIGLVGINYADSTLKIRKLYSFYRISVIKELTAILLTGSIMLFPSLVVSIYATKSIDSFIFGITIFLASVTIGFAFPKSNGNINETVSSLLIIITIILLSFLLSTSWALYPTIVIFTFVLGFVIKKGRSTI